MMYDMISRVLDNGVPITIFRNNGIMSAGITTKVDFGLLHESKNESAHFLEHLIVRNKTQSANSMYVPSLGGRTTYTETIYIAEFYKEYLNTAASMMSDKIIQFNPNDNIIKSEIGTITNELLRHYDVPEFLFSDNVYNLLFSGPDIKTIDETLNLIKNTSTNDVVKSYTDNYTSDKLSVLIYGDINEEKAFTKCAEIFGKMNSGSQRKKLSIKRRNNPKSKTIKKGSGETSSIAFALPLFGQEYYADHIINYISTRTAFDVLMNRLFEKKLISKGLVYAGHSGINIFSNFGYAIGWTTIKSSLMEDVKNEIEDAIAKLYADGISDNEFKIFRKMEFINIALMMDKVELFSTNFMKLKIQDIVKNRSNIEKNINIIKPKNVDTVIRESMDPKNYGFMSIIPEKSIL